MKESQKEILKHHSDILKMLLFSSKSPIEIKVDLQDTRIIISIYRNSEELSATKYQEILDLCVNETSKILFGFRDYDIRNFIIRIYDQENKFIDDKSIEFEKNLPVLKEEVTTFEKLAESIQADKNIKEQRGKQAKIFQIVALTLFSVSCYSLGFLTTFTLLLSTLLVFAVVFASLKGWHGGMVCNNCGYLWKARRKTPPRQCPSCRSRDIKMRKL
jgi:hypothetical protein